MGDCVEIRILDRERHEYVKNVQFTLATEGEHIPVAVQLVPSQAQTLMDQLWECGLRPTEGTGSAGALAAVERHLADMKKIAFHVMRISTEKTP